MTPKHIALAAAAAFVVGGGAIVYYGRPVMKLPQNDRPSIAVGEPAPGGTGTVQGDTGVVSIPVSGTPKTDTPAPTAGGYTMATVAKHNTQEDCWSAVNGSVYDLTTWISRHPGGPGPILRMCGADGSASFNRQHGGSGRPQAALALLKIGSLQ